MLVMLTFRCQGFKLGDVAAESNQHFIAIVMDDLFVQIIIDLCFCVAFLASVIAALFGTIETLNPICHYFHIFAVRPVTLVDVSMLAA